eukprot:TRINITY_DN13570_c0_g1_i1.p1 TRINITY_DN13570_c0_g1~~TRINITY_DN13570_c0_g1_i1.p1  ORF type:complete len:151 (-),score=70.88 TRINITY_DN13570_c0_g1_i1:190-642(-)
MAGELDPEELEEWRTIFNLFDVDGDESITCQELGVVLRSMGQNPSDQELKEMINEMDEDGSGTVDFEEFVILMKKKTADAEGNDDIEEAFRVFDTKNDGVICAEELMSVMVSLGNPRTEEEIKAMIAEEDKDGDGVITKEEFMQMLQRKI